MINVRSTSQNAYLHAVFNAIAKFNEDVSIERVKHDVMVAIGETEYKPNIYTGEEVLVRKFTSEMTTLECAELIDKVRHFAEEFLGLYIPTPEEFKEGMKSYKK